MEDKRKQGFHTVETNMEELENKIRNHRRKVVRRLAIIIIIGVILLCAGKIYLDLKSYDGYEVISKIERVDSAATRYIEFNQNILRYNNDGAFYADSADNLIWNQAYEMQNPATSTCEGYVAVFDKHGNMIYIMDTIGVQGEIETNRPIEAVCVANQGSVAVLTRQDGTSYLEVYNKKGESLASGEIHMANSGYPLDIALSNDANKLAVSMLDINEGKTKTTIAFYNFGSVGQNEIDNIVSSYSYKNTVIPEIGFSSNDRMIAFGDNQVIIFEGTQKPEETVALKIKKEIKSIFYDEDYFGLVYSNADAKDTHKVKIYDMKGKEKLEKDFDMPYSNIEFLGNNGICITSENTCNIFTLRGVEKFRYKFDTPIFKVISGKNDRYYTFILNGVTERVRLK